MLLSKLLEGGIRRGNFHSLRLQLLLVLTCGVWIPSLVTAGAFYFSSPTRTGAWISVAGASFAAVTLVFMLRRFSVYPSTSVVRSILPMLASLYGGLLALLVFFRLEYSNQILLSSFVATLGARFVIAAINMRGKRMVYWIVPGGKVVAVEELSNVPSLRVETPDDFNKYNGVFVADLHYPHDPVWERFLADAAISGKPVFHYKQVWEAATGKVKIHHLSENSFGALIPSHGYQKIKRLVDLLICISTLPITLPVLALVGILIRFDNHGPVFFRQRRMGFRGQAFMLVKFRTMTVVENGDDRFASVTQAGDQRITRIGRFLRKTRLDELPQIWNILKADMSWIGPRPETVSLSAWYEEEIPFYRYRHIVRPGITGWAQVNQGHVSSIDDVDHKLQYDFYYIKNLSYWLDILITLRTIRVVLSGFGAK